MSSKIQTHKGKRPIDRSAESMPKSWVWADNVVALPETSKRSSKLCNRLSKAEAVVCLLTECMEDTKVISALHELSQEGRRIYLLVGKYTTSLNQLKGHCLIRELPKNEVPRGSLLLIDPNSNNSKAYLLSDELTDSTSLELLSLIDEDKHETLFRYYCFLFWERATKEYLHQEQSEGQAIKDKGIDVYFDAKDLSRSYLYDLLLLPAEGKERASFLGKYLSFEKEGENLCIESSGLLQLPDIQLPNLPERMQLEKTMPESFEDDLRYLVITYHWDTHPLYLPKNAKVSALYDEWEKFGANKRKELSELQNRIHNKIKEAETARGTVLARYYTLLKHELDNLLKQFTPLLDVTWGQDRESFDKLDTADDLGKLYNLACQELEYELNRHEIERSIQEIEDQIKKYKQEQLVQEKEHADNAKNPKQDLQQDEINRLEGNLKLLRQKSSLISSNHETNHSELDYIYGDKSLEIADKVKNTKPNLLLIPIVGKLYEAENRLYLAISDWRDYETASNEACRLNATLCAVREQGK